MITVKSEGAARLLEPLEDMVRTGRAPTDEEIDDVLSTESMSLMIRTYSKAPEFSRAGYAAILRKLTNPNPASEGLILSKLEEGLRSCLNYEKIALLRRRLKRFWNLAL